MPMFVNCGSQLLFCIMNLSQCMSVQIFSVLRIHVAIFWVQHGTLMQMGAEILPEFVGNILLRNNEIRL
jgi:hypothetical protein